MAKSKKQLELESKIDELTHDLKRSRADFENYRNRIVVEKDQARIAGQTNTILKLLPTIDNIERAISHVPKELEGNMWVEGVVKLTKNLEKSLSELDVKRIIATPGTAFNPDLHEAIQLDDDAEGEHEVIAEELQAGYMIGGTVVRHSLVKVTKQ